MSSLQYLLSTNQSFNPSHIVGVAIGSWDGLSNRVAIWLRVAITQLGAMVMTRESNLESLPLSDKL